MHSTKENTSKITKQSCILCWILYAFELNNAVDAWFFPSSSSLLCWWEFVYKRHRNYDGVVQQPKSNWKAKIDIVVVGADAEKFAAAFACIELLLLYHLRMDGRHLDTPHTHTEVWTSQCHLDRIYHIHIYCECIHPVRSPSTREKWRT